MPTAHTHLKIHVSGPLALFCVLILECLFTLSCARFDPKPLSASDHAQALENRSLTNDFLKVTLEQNLQRDFPDWPPREWDLDMLTLAAFCYHPGLSVARAEWAVAQGAEKTAAQRPNPALNVTPGYNTTTPTPSPWIPLGTIDWPIETAGKRRYRRAQAANLSEAARLHLATAGWQLRSSLRLALIDLQAAETRQGLIQQQLELQEKALALVEQQVKAGARSAADALPLRIAVVKSRVDVADARRAFSDSRANLADAIGLPLAAFHDIHFSNILTNQSDLSQLTAPELRRTALLSRADVLGALAEYAASQSALQLEIARQYPDLRVIPGYQYDQGDNKWSLGLTVDLPILNQNQGPIAEARARREQSAARFDSVQAKALSEIDRSTEGLRLADQSESDLRALAQEQAQRRDSISAQVKAGALEPLDLVSVQVEYAATELSLLDGHVRTIKARAALEDAVQRPFELLPLVFNGGLRAATSANPPRQ